MTPTMYWAIGNYIPLPIQGRYWTFYQFGVFLEPEELARKIIASALWEFWYDNVGWCRFHRGWMKPVLRALFMEAYGENVDMEEHARRQIKRLIEYAKKAGYGPVFWDSMRVIDLVAAGGARSSGTSAGRRSSGSTRSARPRSTSRRCSTPTARSWASSGGSDLPFLLPAR